MVDIFEDYHEDSLDFFTYHGELDDDAYWDILKNSIDIGWLSSQDCVRLDDLFTRMKNIGVKISYLHSGYIEFGKMEYTEMILDEYIDGIRLRGEPYYERTFARFRAIIDTALERRAHIVMAAD